MRDHASQDSTGIQPSGKAGVSPHLQSKQAGVQPQTGLFLLSLGLVRGMKEGEKRINRWLGNGTLLISGYILDPVITLFLVYPFSLLRTEQQRIADIFVKKGPYLKMYSTYIKEFDKNIALLDEQCKKNPGFAAVVREFEVFLLPSSVLLPLSLF